MCSMTQRLYLQKSFSTKEKLNEIFKLLKMKNCKKIPLVIKNTYFAIASPHTKCLIFSTTGPIHIV